ncbi:TlpA family protein disulfide reductase [Edaphobacter bradus]|uniref:TlpA family protein disulfide reductase n=1 Tax=Edaphobacter bradus TaxID=2259016 RepID=UPI0021DF886B|nr:TlpA disulfide reductase family protein [Edaphobacter bradus]
MNPFVSLPARLLSAILFASAAAQLLAQPATQDPAVLSALHESADFHQRGQLTSALDSARKALKLAKGSCAECQRQIVALQIEMDRPHDAAASAAAWASHAATPTEKAAAEYLQARALVLEDHEKHSDSLLQRADQALKQAAVDNPSDPATHLLEGRVLAALKRDSDAKAQFAACLTTPGATPLQCRRASAYAQNIALTTNDEAPEFTIRRADGTAVTLDSLAGEVVLIDFWATWCGPCSRDLDYVQSIAEEFQHDNFVLLGISTDENEAKWKSHVAENRMIGIQVRDGNHAVNDLFHVNGIPTYLILDGNGIIRFRTTGALKDLRTKVREVLKESAPTPSTTQSVVRTAGN